MTPLSSFRHQQRQAQQQQHGRRRRLEFARPAALCCSLINLDRSSTAHRTGRPSPPSLAACAPAASWRRRRPATARHPPGLPAAAAGPWSTATARSCPPLPRRLLAGYVSFIIDDISYVIVHEELFSFYE
ncbi:hypothetical protein BS78_05G224700 [Paspalum vaginatum]|nr:hypothetical protein BS78_05G224700 [Paspalum vaginatum]